MRIKSYFAHSVQAAISLARHEFGDDVTLVTSHVAAHDTRHLGEYEVVFAVDEPAEVVAGQASEAEAVPKFTAFQEVLLDAVAKKPASREVLEQIDSVRSTLIQLGVEPSMVRALMTLVQRSIDAPVMLSAELPVEPAAADSAGTMLWQLADSLSAAGPEAAHAEPEMAAKKLVEPWRHDAAYTPEKFAFAVAAGWNAASGHTAVIAGLGAKATPSPVNVPHPRLTPAELAFAMSISEVSDAAPLLTL